MPLGLSMTPSTASTATMFSFASTNSQLGHSTQSSYNANTGGNDPLAQRKSVTPSQTKTKGPSIGRALSGFGKRAGGVFSGRSSSSSTKRAPEAAKASATAVNHGTMSGCAAAWPPNQQRAGVVASPSTNQVNSVGNSGRNFGFSENCTGCVNQNFDSASVNANSVSFAQRVQAEAVGSGGDNVSASGRAKKKPKSALTKVRHEYQDYSNVTDEDALQDAVERKNTGGVVTPFPEKLHEMLSANKETDVIDWAPHGRCFVIKKPKVFTATIMPKNFKHTKITSFQRQLNLYGFKRITKGKDRGAYYHELFLRGRPKLSTKMRRQRIKGVGHKPLPDPENEPDFYAMDPLDPPVGAEEKIEGDVESRASSGGLVSAAGSHHSPTVASVAASLSLNSLLGASPVQSVVSSVLSATALSAATASSMQQAQVLGVTQQMGMSSQSSTSQRSNELNLLSQMLEHQRQQIEIQQRQLQQRQQQLLQEELIMQQKEVLLQQQQQRQQQLLQGQAPQVIQGTAVPPSATAPASLPAASVPMMLNPTNMNINVPMNCDVTVADVSAVSGADASDVGTFDGSSPAEGVGFDANAMDVDPVEGPTKTSQAHQVSRVQSAVVIESKSINVPHILKGNDSKSDAVPHILRDISKASEDDPSFGTNLSSSDGGSKKEHKSLGSISKRISLKSWGSVGSVSKTSKASMASSYRRKIPWSRRSHASASSGGSDDWIDHDRKMALEATIDFDSIFEGASAH